MSDTTAEGDVLPDSLRAGLKLVFVGTAAGDHSAAAGAYYAHPGNRFWSTLFRTGLTPRLFEPHEFRTLLDLGIGFTDVAKRAHGMDHEIAPSAFSVSGLQQKMAAFAPARIAFTSKRAAAVVLGRPTRDIPYGRQPPSDGPQVWVLPSTSGAASPFWSIEPWRRLSDEMRAKT